MAPTQAIVKGLTVNKSTNEVFNFFTDFKDMEIGGAIKSVRGYRDGWWQFDHTVAGNEKMKIIRISDQGILDHEDEGAGLRWKMNFRGS